MDLSQLKSLLPSTAIQQIPGIEKTYGINTPLRLAHFLSQCSHESVNFKVVHENLNYSATALTKVFHKYFSTPELVAEYTRNPEKIGNRVYANRMGNGDEASGDGYRYRGRGYIQLTGRNNYAAFGGVVHDNLIAQPDLVATKYPLASAGWFWYTRRVNAIADGGADNHTVTRVTKIINGGSNGLSDRLKLFYIYYAGLQ